MMMRRFEITAESEDGAKIIVLLRYDAAEPAGAVEDFYRDHPDGFNVVRVDELGAYDLVIGEE